MENDDITPDAAPEGATPTDRPLGYWLRVVDALISRRFAEAFEAEDVSRRDWMLLNALSGAVDVPGLADKLARRGKRLRSLEDRGWVAETGDGRWELTDEGRAAQAHLSEIVSGIRSSVSGAVSPEDFATMTASLEAIARELGYDENERLGRGFGVRGFGRGFRGGFGPGFRPGFAGYGGFGPGFGPGFDPRERDADEREDDRPRRPFGPGFGPGGFGPRGFGPRGFGRGFGPGFDPRERFGPGFDPRAGSGSGHGRCGEHAHGDYAHGEHRHGGGRKGERHSERAYERGFQAGFDASRRAATSDASDSAV